MTIRKFKLALSIASVCLLSFLQATAHAADAPATVRGLIFISPSGEPEGDLVMRAAGVEVMLVRAEEGFDSELEVVRRSRLSAIDKQFQAVNSAQAELLRSAGRPPQEQQKKAAAVKLERSKLAELTTAYEKEVMDLIVKHTHIKTKADSEGKFSLTGMPPGRYFLHSHFEILAMGIHYYWLVPVDVKGDKQIEVTLNKLNATTQL
jgi:hypothetical protein